MPPVKVSKKKSKKKGPKKPKILPDPDAQFRELLEGELYIPQNTRRINREQQLQVISDAISTFTVATPETQSLSVLATVDETQAGGDANASEGGGLGTSSPLRVVAKPIIPITKLESIVRAVGFCPTKDQMSQLIAMVTVLPPNASEKRVDHDKLESILLTLFDTRILLYEPLQLEQPHHNFPTRCISVVYMMHEGRLQACFDSLWSSCGSRTVRSEEADVRCIDITDLQAIALDGTGEASGELPFTQNELDELLFAFRDSQRSIIREDTFLLTMMHVL